jgi:hypothetical protein
LKVRGSRVRRVSVQKVFPVGGDSSGWSWNGLVEGMVLSGCEVRSLHVLVGPVIPKPVFPRLEAADDRVT